MFILYTPVINTCTSIFLTMNICNVIKCYMNFCLRYFLKNILRNCKFDTDIFYVLIINKNLPTSQL